MIKEKLQRLRGSLTMNDRVKRAALGFRDDESGDVIRQLLTDTVVQDLRQKAGYIPLVADTPADDLPYHEIVGKVATELDWKDMWNRRKEMTPVKVINALVWLANERHAKAEIERLRRLAKFKQNGEKGGFTIG